MTERMEIAIHAMEVLIKQDFKYLSFSARSGGHKSIAAYVADESFIFADAMIEKETKKESPIDHPIRVDCKKKDSDDK